MNIFIITTYLAIGFLLSSLFIVWDYCHWYGPGDFGDYFDKGTFFIFIFIGMIILWPCIVLTISLFVFLKKWFEFLVSIFERRKNKDD